VVDPRWALPVDPALLAAAAEYRLVVTVEDNGAAGGFGDAFCRVARQAQLTVPTRTLGVAQRFLPHGPRDALLAAQGLDAEGVVAAVRAALGAEDHRSIAAPR
jgi:1-deoxy-D-xylulose-5-phosphate synthase